MARGIFNPEGEFLRKLHEERRREEAENEPPQLEDEPAEETPEEEEVRVKLEEEAAARYESGVVKNPIKKETGKRLAPHLEAEIEEKIIRRDVAAAAEKPFGLKSTRGTRGWKRGHRKGLKPVKPRRLKEAA